jgi:hypothetical protein
MVQKNGEHWECKCGNALFFIRPQGVYCPNCGLEHGELPLSDGS